MEENNVKVEIVYNHDYSEHPVILELYLEDEAIFRRITNVIKFIEFSDGHSEVIREDGSVTYVKRNVVMYKAYNRNKI